MTTNRNFAVLGLAVLMAAGCNVQDATTPVPQPDSLVLGRIAAVRESADKGVWEVEINEGLPETMQGAMRHEGRPVPQLDKDVKVRIRVTADTVCVAGERASGLDDFRVGQEVAVNPVPGTTAMVGSKLLLADAAEMYLFSVYQIRYLPRSLQALPAEASLPDDPKLVNSAGLEMTPLAADAGKVVYFAAGLRAGVPTSGARRPPVGAVRPGMRDGKGALAPWAVGGYRPYRTRVGERRLEPATARGVRRRRPGRQRPSHLDQRRGDRLPGRGDAAERGARAATRASGPTRRPRGRRS